MVKALRHDFNVPTQEHEMSLTLVKDCVEEELPFSETSPEPKVSQEGIIHKHFYETVNAAGGSGAW